MKKKSEIKSKLISFIKVVLALGAMIAICTFISRGYGLDAYATETATEMPTETATETNSEAAAELAIQTATNTVSQLDKWEITGNPSKIYYKDGVTVYPSGVSIEGYKGNIIYGSNFNIPVNDYSKGDTIKDARATDDKEYTFQVADCKLAGNKTGTIKESTGSLSGLISAIGDQNVLTFNAANLTVLVDESAPIPSKPSQYSKLESGGFAKDDDHEDVGISASISSSLVGEILDYVYEKGNEKLKALIKAIMESGDDLSIAVSVTKMEKSDVPDNEYEDMKDKARSYDDADDAKLVRFYDISVYVVSGNKYIPDLPISNTGSSIKFKYKVPSSVKSSSSSANKKRYYNVVRYHDGGHGVGRDYTTDTEFSFSVNEFSNFSTAYYDKSSSSSSSSSSSRSSSGSNLPRTSSGNATTGAGGGGGTGSGGGAPKTGDDFDARKWVFFMVVGVVVALCSFILYQDTKDWREEKKDVRAE